MKFMKIMRKAFEKKKTNKYFKFYETANLL